MAKRPVNINLVKTDRSQTVNQLINWALGTGRILIICVELVALAAFLYRFVLDGQLQDVHSKIKQEQTVLAQQQKNENTYTNLQERLSLASTLSDKALVNTKIFKDIIGFAPIGMTFTDVSLVDQGINMEANLNSIYPLATFINSIKNYPKTDIVSINKIENKTASAVINVSIFVTFKEEGDMNANSGN